MNETELAPGLLPVFRLAAGIRLGFMALVATLVLVLQLPGQALALPMLAEGALFLGALSWMRLQVWLGRWYLPLLLAWSIFNPLLARALLLGSRARAQVGLEAAADLLPGGLPKVDLFVGASFNLAWLAVPVILATWQYGRRGLVVTMTVVTLGSVAAELLPASSAAAAAVALLDLAGRLALIGLVAIVVAQLAAAQRREQQALQLANRQLALRAVMAEELAASRERNRLARELHDTLAHTLTGVSVQLQALGKLMGSDPSAAQMQLKAAQVTVREGIQEARRAIQALRATPLADLGLSEALRQLCQNFAARVGIAIVCQIDDVTLVAPATAEAFYRTAEAALANVEQHAQAGQVTLTLAAHKSGLRLSVRDDGAGFDPAQVAADRYGLAGMRERASAIGATLAMRSAPGRGTEIVLAIGDCNP